MFKSKQSLTSHSVMTRKSSSNQNQQLTQRQVQLPCPSHTQYHISHLCLSPSCQQNISFCSECLFEPQQQQHIAKHKEHVIGWSDFMQLCKKLSVSGRIGDSISDNYKTKDVMNLVFQTQVHQQQFKQHMRQQEQMMIQDFDQLTLQFQNDINKIKHDLLNQYRNYQQDLGEMGTILEKLVQEYYQNKGESKDYNNDFDNFLKEITKIQEQWQAQENKLIRQSLPSGIQNSLPQTQFNLRKIMQNIVPLLSKANSSFQKTIQSQQPSDSDNQSSVSGLSLFSSFSIKHQENNILQDAISEYKNLLDNRPYYKNQGLPQQIYQQAIEQLQKVYHSLNDAIVHFVTPTYKSSFKHFKLQNKENQEQSSLSTVPKTRLCNSPLRNSYKQLKQLTRVAQNQLGKTQDILQDDDYREIYERQSYIKQVNSGQLSLGSKEEGIEPPTFISLDHKKTIQTSHKGGINCIQLVDEDFIATGSNDKTVKIWRLGSFELIKEVQFKSDVTALATLIRPDGSTMLVVGLFRSICLLNQGYEIVKYYDSQPQFIDKESQLSINQLHQPKITITVNLYDNQNPTNQVVSQIVHSGQINSILPISDGQSVITISQGDNKIVQWNLIDVQNNVPKKYFEHRDSVTCLSNVNGDLQIASAGKDRGIKVFTLVYHDKDFKHGALDKLQLCLSIPDAHQTEITALNSTPSPSLIMSICSTGELKMWDSADGALMRTVKNYSGWGYRILYLYQAQANKSAQNDLLTKQTRYGSPQRTNLQKQTKIQQFTPQLRNSHFITFSFDGTMKMHNSASLIVENSNGNYNPILSVQTKSLLDCHPFGGVLAIKDQITDKIEILTSGNKNDNALQIYALKEE